MWTVDLDEPIALIPDDNLTPAAVRDLQHAADCWNTQFGVRLELGADVDTGQTVDVAFNDFACLIATGAGGHFHAKPLGEIELCPTEYLPDRGSQLQFAIILHELGHVVNIFDHGRDPDSVMGGALDAASGNTGERAFADEDIELFIDANPDFARDAACSARLVFVFEDGGMSCSACP